MLLVPKPVDLRLERGFDRPVRRLNDDHAPATTASLADTLDLDGGTLEVRGDVVFPARNVCPKIVAAPEYATHTSSNTNILKRRDPKQREFTRYFK